MELGVWRSLYWYGRIPSSKVHHSFNFKIINSTQFSNQIVMIFLGLPKKAVSQLLVELSRTLNRQTLIFGYE